MDKPLSRVQLPLEQIDAAFSRMALPGEYGRVTIAIHLDPAEAIASVKFKATYHRTSQKPVTQDEGPIHVDGDRMKAIREKVFNHCRNLRIEIRPSLIFVGHFRDGYLAGVETIEPESSIENNSISPPNPFKR